MKEIVVLGAGLVGSLSAMLLARRGYSVTVFDKRPEVGSSGTQSRRTINMALSERGWRALREVGVADEVHPFAIPLAGRMIHQPDGRTVTQPYGKAGQAIYSVARERLNALLVEKARHHYQVQFRFGYKCTGVELEGPRIFLEHLDTQRQLTVEPEVLIGADGAFSRVRDGLQKQTDLAFRQQQHYIEHGYKELTLPARDGGGWSLPENFLHVWPRNRFMFIALPNPEGTFTGTLFLPFEGEVSFATIRTEADVLQLFGTYFPDALPLMPDLGREYAGNCTWPLASIRCFPWSYRGKATLIGDASHTLLPFYGQGMNTGFEDAMAMDQLMDGFGGDWETLFDRFQRSRKAHTDAITELAFQNFVEMREKTMNPAYLFRKKIEAHISSKHPDLWTPLYSMVSFSNIPFAEVLATGRRQERIMDKVMGLRGVEHDWERLDYPALIRDEPQVQQQAFNR